MNKSAESRNKWQLWLLYLSSFLFFASFNMIIPELPDLLTELGGGDYKGLIISLFTLTAMLSRPFSGKLADTVGRIPVMVFGAAVSMVVSLLYPFVTSVVGFLFLRFIHGFSTGFKPTGTSAYLADIAPFNKRGQIMGIQGFFASLGMAAGPALGAWIAQHLSLDLMFYCSSLFGFLSVAVLIGMKETVENKEAFSVNLLKIKGKDFFEPRVLKPSIVLLLTTFSFGAVLTLTPDLSVHLDVGNKGLFFSVFVVASLAVRLLAGRVSDRFGREPVLLVSTALIAVSMFLLAFAQNERDLILAGLVFGLAIGGNSPTIYAWTIDLSEERFRGRGLATMYIFLEIGIGLGALISAELYSNIDFFKPFAFSGFLAVLACAYVGFLLFQKKRQ